MNGIWDQGVCQVKFVDQVRPVTKGSEGCAVARHPSKRVPRRNFVRLVRPLGDLNIESIHERNDITKMIEGGTDGLQSEESL